MYVLPEMENSYVKPKKPHKTKTWNCCARKDS